MLNLIILIILATVYLIFLQGMILAYVTSFCQRHLSVGHCFKSIVFKPKGNIVGYYTRLIIGKTLKEHMQANF